MNLQDHPHRRMNILTGDWVLVSPHRMKRPWQGKTESVHKDNQPVYDPNCYLCPGNERAGGAKNPDYTGPYVFTNDFAALLPGTPTGEERTGDLLIAEGETGTSRVVCFSPRHDRTLAMMDTGSIAAVVRTWRTEYEELGARDDIGYVQIFENKGQMMGCSNPHPHGQIWATRTVPGVPEAESARQREYQSAHGSCMLCDYTALEVEKGERIVLENEHFVALVPFWAVWPFETMIVSRRHAASLSDLHDESVEALADVIRRLCIRYDNLFTTSFPYSMGIHQAPTDGGSHGSWHFHFHFYPPLLRSASVKKFMVGFEMLATPQRDITAEAAAVRLRELPDIRFSDG